MLVVPSPGGTKLVKLKPGITAMEISKTTIGIAAGVAGTLFLGYCIYFDHKRRKDPDFKKKLRESERTGKAEENRRFLMWNFLFFMVRFRM